MNLETSWLPQVHRYPENGNKETNVSHQGLASRRTGDQVEQEAMESARKVLGLASKALANIKKSYPCESSETLSQKDVKKLIYAEKTRLESGRVVDMEQFKKFHPEAYIDEKGILKLSPYSGLGANNVIKQIDYADDNRIEKLIEYRDGKPNMMIVQNSGSGTTEIKLIKYDYPADSLAATRKEISTLHSWNAEGSLDVPTPINQEIGIDL